MKPLAVGSTAKGLAFWNVVRAGWMGYLLLAGLRGLAFSGNNEPYVGLGIDRNLILSVSAMPTRLVCLLAGFQFGRIGEMSAEAIAVLAYCLAVLGIWGRKTVAAAFAILLVSAESFLLAVCLRYAVTTTLLPEFRGFAVVSGFAFLTIYSFSAIYLLRQNFNRLFRGGTTKCDADLPTHH